MRIDIQDLIEDFPDFRVAAIVAEGLAIASARDEDLEADIARREAAVRDRWATCQLSEIPGIAVWRRAYRQFGVKKTSYRCSVERLIKNTLAGRPLPTINPFVDAYNSVSMSHVFPCGADDLDRVDGDIAFRYARPEDTFLDMAAAGDPRPDPPKAGEVVYADAAKVLCRRWNWRQDGRSLVGPATRRAVVTVQFNGEGDLGAAIDDVTGLLARHCGAHCSVTVADAQSPVMALGPCDT